MPIYEFECSECTHQFENFYTIANMDMPLEEPCPSCYKIGYIERLISGAIVCDPVALGVIKPTKAFNERLTAVKKAHRGSTIEVRD